MTQPSAAWLAEQRWFASTGRIEDPVMVVSTTIDGRLTIGLGSVGGHHYQLVTTTDQADSLGEPATGAALARAFAGEVQAAGTAGAVSFHRVGDQSIPEGPIRLLEGEQSNSSVIIGDRMILKVIRRPQPGPNPEVEMLGLLGDRGCGGVPALTGWYEIDGGPIDATLGVLQEFVAEGADGWQLVLDGLAADPGATLPRLRDLGVALARLHTVLGAPTEDPAFSPVRGGGQPADRLAGSIAADAGQIRVRLADHPGVTDQRRLTGDLVVAVALASRLAGRLDTGPAIRCHGDLHLGQTLHTPQGWMIIDWEGEPARTLEDRRAKQSPLRDVAGMLRSFAYAAAAHDRRNGAAANGPSAAGWLMAARAAFLDGYLFCADGELLPPDPSTTVRLLALLELEKVVYEIGYELGHRPDWLAIPVAGLRSLLETNRL